MGLNTKLTGFIIYLFCINDNFAHELKCDDNFNEAEDRYCGNNTSIEGFESCKESGATECSDWCNGEVHASVLESDSGQVALWLEGSPLSCCHNCFAVELHTSEEPFCTEGETTMKNIHSFAKLYAAGGSRTKRNGQILNMTFEFVFTSCYQLKIIPHYEGNTRQPCYTKNFFMETNYKKHLLVTSNTTFAPSFLPQGDLLGVPVDFGNNFLGGTLPKSAIARLNSDIDMDLDDCSDTGTRHTCCVVDPNNQLISGSKDECACKWVDQKLDCSFYNIENGLYCFEIELVDRRCVSGTLWIPNGKHCRWHYSMNLTGTKTPSLVTSNRDRINIYPILLSFGGILTITIVGIWVFRHRRKPLQNGIYNPLFTNEAAPLSVLSYERMTMIKVWLVYPRDCQPFMNVMKELRGVLQSINIQVYDVWDPDTENSVAENIKAWVVYNLTDTNTKIILIASSCSTLIYKAISHDEEIEYMQPHFCDPVFSMVLSSLLGSTDYNRVFVLRLDEDELNENLTLYSFINPTTVYTIPQQLKSLTHAILNLESSEVINLDRPQQIPQLTTAINNLKEYKLKNPKYLDDILYSKSRSK